CLLPVLTARNATPGRPGHARGPGTRPPARPARAAARRGSRHRPRTRRAWPWRDSTYPRPCWGLSDRHRASAEQAENRARCPPWWRTCRPCGCTPRRAAIPAAVGVLMTRQPVQGALNRLLAGLAGAATLGQDRAIRIEPRAVKPWHLAQVATAHGSRQVGERGARTSPIVPSWDGTHQRNRPPQNLASGP